MLRAAGSRTTRWPGRYWHRALRYWWFRLPRLSRADSFGGACLQEGPTELVQDGLQQSKIVNHSQLETALDFIRQQNLRDGELTVYSGYLVGVYRELDIEPSTRFVLLDVEARVFPSRVGEMAQSLDQSQQRFVISNLIESGFPPSDLGDGDSRSEPACRRHSPHHGSMSFRTTSISFFAAAPIWFTKSRRLWNP